MIYKGFKFRTSKTIVTLPELKDGVYVQFGRVVQNGKDNKKAVTTNYIWADTNTKVLAIPLDGLSWSMTNMAYHNETRTVILFKGGKCFTAKF